MSMASKPLLASLLVSLLLLHQLAEADHTTEVSVDDGPKHSAVSKKIDCGVACSARCKLASRQKICKRACGTCCARCACVPPGTAGHQEECPCYASLKTHGGRPKCP